MREDIIISAIMQELEKRVKGMITSNYEIYNGSVVFYVKYNSTNIGCSYAMTREEIRDLQYKITKELSADVIPVIVNNIILSWKKELIEELFYE